MPSENLQPCIVEAFSFTPSIILLSFAESSEISPYRCIDVLLKSIEMHSVSNSFILIKIFYSRSKITLFYSVLSD